MGGRTSKSSKSAKPQGKRMASALKTDPSAPKELPDSVLFREAHHGSFIVDALRKQRDEDRFCDITLRVGATIVRAHRAVLAASSAYFAALLSPNMREGQQDQIELDHLDGPVVSSLVDYIYSGQLLITTDNVQKLLQTGDFLDIGGVKKACSQFIKQRLDADCCVGVLQLADRLGDAELYDAALIFFRQNFQMIVESEDFNNLQPDAFTRILEDEALCLSVDAMPLSPDAQEAQLAHTVIRYVKADPEGRSGHLVGLLSNVRLPLVGPRDLALLKQALQEFQEESQALYDGDSTGQCVLAVELLDKAGRTPVRDAVEITSTPWSRPRRFAGLKYIPSDKYAAGHIRPEILNFDDKEIAAGSYMVGMKIWIRRWDGRPVVGGFLISYKNGSSILHGGDTSPEHYEFSLQRGEHIIRMDIRSGWLVDSMSFKTNKGRTFGPYGGDGGNGHHINPPGNGGFLAYLRGSVVDTQNSLAITNLVFVWGTYNYTLLTKPSKNKK